jgi:hypothetical protein
MAVVTAPWWTEADAGELDLLIYEFVRRIADHRERCADCLAGDECEQYLNATRVGVEAVTDWQQARELRSKAEWLRRREEAA